MLKKAFNWLIYVVAFSCVPIIINMGWDFITTPENKAFMKGIRLIDFLICGFCFIGGALGDRFNSREKPSPPAIGIGFLLAISALGLYCYAKATYNLVANESGLYIREGFFITGILVFFVLAVIYSVSVLHCTWSRE